MKVDALDEFYQEFSMSKYATEEDRDADIAKRIYSMRRPEFTRENISDAISELKCKIEYRLNQKGYKHLSSDFECMGILDQEIYEYRKAVHEKMHNRAKIEELLDIAWAALLGIMMHERILDKDNDSPSSHLF